MEEREGKKKIEGSNRAGGTVQRGRGSWIFPKKVAKGGHLQQVLDSAASGCQESATLIGLKVSLAKRHECSVGAGRGRTSMRDLHTSG